MSFVTERQILHLYIYDRRLQEFIASLHLEWPLLCVSAQDAAMVVPPLRRSRICWQSCRERRSPTRSRVRLASASRRARCPGGVSRGIGKWRQASRMAWALSLSPRTHSPSESNMGGELGPITKRHLLYLCKYRFMLSLRRYYYLILSLTRVALKST